MRGVVRAAASLPMLAALVGCLPEVERPTGGQLAVRDVQSSDEMQLETVCVPTGPERCFDALDDNCNGIIDEGCGLQTGILQFAIAWQQPEADVDLNVSGPDGELARYDEPTESGLLKDRDCPGTEGECRGQNVENVFLATGPPQRGRYRVVVRLEDPGPASGPIRVRLSARIGQRHFTSEVRLASQADEQVFAFSL